ncbi:hypothetical protein F2P81_005148 [Scophthalmus maximus]|uniref:Uncharacterized protein n=1 Tax=Scophthalmus maximus TaxID=52904 RepID=A0A6A4T2C8_SCOMX|nr:hypothetical protein F2P81_005148 [Scophthalmus maximus]
MHSERIIISLFFVGVSRNAGLEVDSGERRVISSVSLEAEDVDTPPNQVFYFINAAPRFGNLQLKTESGWTELSAGRNFTQDDVEMNRLWYKHAADSAAAFKGHDSFRFTLSDLDNESPAQSFFVSVRTVQKGDIVLLSTAVHLREGQRVVLTTDILLASDAAARPEELVFTVTVPPRHGLVHAVRRPGVPLGSFTQLDVAAHRVCYTHDNGHDAESDAFSFVVTNGVSSRSGSLHFTVEHGDRIPPTLRHNAGLRLQDGATETIGGERLQLTDPDTAAANLSYVVTQPPRYGKLLLRGVPLTPPLRFTQTDVDGLNLAYRQDPGSPAEVDGFHFLPSDGHNRGLELCWSRVDLSATCYRTCETSGTLQIQIQRSGRSVDPAYVAIQVEEGSAKPGRDFTHSSAGLIQFDPECEVRQQLVSRRLDSLQETLLHHQPVGGELGERREDLLTDVQQQPDQRSLPEGHDLAVEVRREEAILDRSVRRFERLDVVGRPLAVLLQAAGGAAEPPRWRLRLRAG